jgi:hypothetical protein
MISRAEAVTTAGIAKMIRKELTSSAQTKSGIRSSVMPGARSLKTVTMTEIATEIPATSVKVIICAQISARLPGENSGPDSGT